MTAMTKMGFYRLYRTLNPACPGCAIVAAAGRLFRLDEEPDAGPGRTSAANQPRMTGSAAQPEAGEEVSNLLTGGGKAVPADSPRVGGSGGGVVYVISDRLGGRDLSGVMMHEFGHVLGAGHGQHGLMAPVYSLDGARCIDYAAAGLVAQAQRLPLAGMNWCEGAGRERMPAANAGANHGYTSSSVRGQARD